MSKDPLAIAMHLTPEFDLILAAIAQHVPPAKHAALAGRWYDLMHDPENNQVFDGLVAWLKDIKVLVG